MKKITFNKATNVDKEETKKTKPKVTFLGEGPLIGEYRFAEIAGSIAAESKEAAVAKAEEIVTKHPSLVNKA